MTRPTTSALDRRDFLQLAASAGATLVWAGSARAKPGSWSENRALFPEGVRMKLPQWRHTLQDAASVLHVSRRRED